jgi:hypothetical protein
VSPLDALDPSARALATFIKNAVIADAIGVVDLKDLPPEIDSLVNAAVDNWDAAQDDAVDVTVMLILLILSLGAGADARNNANPADPNRHFPNL